MLLNPKWLLRLQQNKNLLLKTCPFDRDTVSPRHGRGYRPDAQHDRNPPQEKDICLNSSNKTSDIYISYIYIYIYIYIRMSVCVCVHICMCVYMSASIYIYICIYKDTSIYIYIYIYIYVSLYIYIYIYIYVSLYIYIYIYIYKCIHMFVSVHTYIYARSRARVCVFREISSISPTTRCSSHFSVALYIYIYIYIYICIYIVLCLIKDLGLRIRI